MHIQLTYYMMICFVHTPQIQQLIMKSQYNLQILIELSFFSFLRILMPFFKILSIFISVYYQKYSNNVLQYNMPYSCMSYLYNYILYTMYMNI